MARETNNRQTTNNLKPCEMDQDNGPLLEFEINRGGFYFYMDQKKRCYRNGII